MQRVVRGWIWVLACAMALGSCNNGTGDDTQMVDIEVSVSPEGTGTIAPSADSSYEQGETVRLTAEPNEGYRFVAWSGDIEETDENPLSLNADQDYSLTATFVEGYPLSVTTEGEGTVTEEVVSGSGYEPGSVVELTAEPAEGYQFVEWRGDLSSQENPVQVTMDASKEVTAVFDAHLRIHWITDTHLYDEVDGDRNHENARSGNKFFWDASRRLEAFRDIVNDEQPDLAVHTGDMLEGVEQQGWELFTSTWEDITVEKELTIGNHDLNRAGTGEPFYDSVVDGLGYGDREVVEGSHFNSSFSVSPSAADFSARILMVDTNINPASGDHEVSVSGWLSESQVDWIVEEATGSDDDMVLLFMHHGPHEYNVGRFDSGGAMNLSDRLEEVSGKPVTIFFGHAHNQYAQDLENTTLLEFGNLSAPGYLNRAAVDYGEGWFTRILVNSEGEVRFEGEGL